MYCYYYDGSMLNSKVTPQPPLDTSAIFYHWFCQVHPGFNVHHVLQPWCDYGVCYYPYFDFSRPLFDHGKELKFVRWNSCFDECNSIVGKSQIYLSRSVFPLHFYLLRSESCKSFSTNETVFVTEGYSHLMGVYEGDSSRYSCLCYRYMQTKKNSRCVNYVYAGRVRSIDMTIQYSVLSCDKCFYMKNSFP